MVLYAKKVILKDGTEAVIESIQVNDAREMLFHMQTTADETEYMSSYPEEIGTDGKAIKMKEMFIRNILADPKCLYLKATIEGVIVASASLLPVAGRQKASHRGGISVAVIEKYWSKGLGEQLLKCMLEHATDAGYTQMELSVLEKNKAAYGLYRKFGFQVYGTLPGAVRYKDGRDDTAILMFREVQN